MALATATYLSLLTALCTIRRNTALSDILSISIARLSPVAAVFGDASIERRGQSFTVGASPLRVSQCAFDVAKVGIPTDGLRVLLQTDAAGLPSGTVLATSATIPASALGTAMAETIFAWPERPTLAALTKYHLTLERTGAQSPVNYYQAAVSNLGGDPNPGDNALYYPAGGPWTAQPTYDFTFDVYSDATDPKTGLVAASWSAIAANVACRFVNRRGRELVRSEDQVVHREQLCMLPTGTDVREGDVIDSGGKTYDVRLVEDAAGAGHHIEALVQRREL